jgi:hypothetical protein
LLGEEDADLDGFKMVATGWGKTHDGNYFLPQYTLKELWCIFKEL